MCWAQHFTLDIPPVPLHSGAHRVQAKERIAQIFTGTQPGPPSHLPPLRSKYLEVRGRILRPGEAGEAGEEYFNKLATLDLVDFHFK